MSSTAMTLMACYGAPCGTDACIGDLSGPDSWSESGSSSSDWTDSDTQDSDSWQDSDTQDSDTQDSDTQDSDTQGETGDSDDEQCSTGDMVETLDPMDPPVVVYGELNIGTGESAGTCGGSGQERVYAWTPPTTGDYLVSVDSPADLVVYVRDPDVDLGGSCGDELGCAIKLPASRGPRLRLPLSANHRVLIIVDAASSSETGAYTLTIDAL